MSETPTDEALMQSYCDGDVHAFKLLYQRHSGALYRFIAWRSPRQDWVDEIVQDSWAALHTARARYTPSAAFRTYLYQIARNRLLDLVRQKQLRLASEMGGGDDGEGAFEQLADASAHSASPQDELEQKERVATLHEAIRSLPNDQREALVLQQFNGMSLEEIAEVSEVPLETVKSRLRYAMQKLRTQMQGATAKGEPA